MIHVGIDVGSTTVKACAINSDSAEILYSDYKRHNACQSEVAAELLRSILVAFPKEKIRVAFCGSGGRVIAGVVQAPYIQEVVANSIAVRRFYPQSRVAIELGGQDAKIVFFHHDTVTQKLVAGDMRMNGSCAGGTGAFIDEVAALLRTPVEEFNSLAARGTQVYDISGRCGVFAKTDIQPLLNQGALREDVALSTFHAIAKQTIGGLAQGLEIKAPVIFEGGPLTFNSKLIDVFAERLGLQNDDIIKPVHAETIIAYGAALSINEMFANEKTMFSAESALTSLGMFHEIISGENKNHSPLFFSTIREREQFSMRHKMQSIKRDMERIKKIYINGMHDSVLNVYLGIDAGSTTSKFVIIDEQENVVDSFYGPNKGEPLNVMRDALVEMNKKYNEAGITLNVIAVGTTGYGELLFDKAFGADYHTVETVAHAAAAQKYVPGATFILDIGGQDMKAISIQNDIVTNITVNEACSSGCGSFLENFAVNLKIPVNDIAEAAFNAKDPANLGSRCTVFMNSTIITEQKNGKQANDIMAGLCRSIIENVFTKVVRISNPKDLGDKIVVQGGTFKNDAVLRALEQYLGRNVVRAPFPGEMGAIGIALLTKRAITEHGYTSPHGEKGRTRFIGLNTLNNFSFTQETNVVCPFCANSCNRTLLRFSSGENWVTGNRCERGELVPSKDAPQDTSLDGASLDGADEKEALRKKAKEIEARLDAVPDMIKFREKLLFSEYDYKDILPKNGITIGIPRVLDFWRTMPFWKVFWQSLGFNIKISVRSSKKLFEKGLPFVVSDTVCFPAKLVHGHIEDLVAQDIDRIFFPQLNRLPSENGELTSTFTCPVLKSYPLSIKYSNDPEHKHNIAFDAPVFHWFTKRDRDIQLCAFINKTFNIADEKTLAAVALGDKALNQFENTMFEEGGKIIKDVESKNQFAVVIAGRQYQYDELISHNLSRHFTSIGVPVLTIDSIPGISDIKLDKTRVDITNNNHSNLLQAAIIAAQSPSLEFVNIYSFGCGHDAVYTDEITRVMDEISGKTPLILKLDESDIAGPLRIRVRSFIETVMIRRKRLEYGSDAHGTKFVVREQEDPYPVKFTKEHKKDYIVLIPNVSRAFCLMVSSCLKNEGFHAEPMPMGGEEAIALGKKYVHNDICFPAQVVIGEALFALKSGKYDLDKVAIGTGKIMCDCRLTNYVALARKALDDAGFPQVPIVATDLYDFKNAYPGLRFTPIIYAKILWGLIETDVLEYLRRKIRPYEIEKGETDRIVENAFLDIAKGFSKTGISGSMLAFRRGINALCKVRYDRSKPREIVFIQGEYLLTFHVGSNLHIERYLEKNGFEVALPRMHDVFRHLFVMHTVSEMDDFKVRHSLFDTVYARVGDRFIDFASKIVDKAAQKHPLFEPSISLQKMAKLSDDIIHHSVMSGESFMIAADILHRIEQGVRSFVVLQPFGCLPNHVCGRGVIKKIKELHPNVQILPLDYDPDVSFANIENRLQMLIMNARAQNVNSDNVNSLNAA